MIECRWFALGQCIRFLGRLLRFSNGHQSSLNELKRRAVSQLIGQYLQVLHGYGALPCSSQLAPPPYQVHLFDCPEQPYPGMVSMVWPDQVPNSSHQVVPHLGQPWVSHLNATVLSCNCALSAQNYHCLLMDQICLHDVLRQTTRISAPHHSTYPSAFNWSLSLRGLSRWAGRSYSLQKSDTSMVNQDLQSEAIWFAQSLRVTRNHCHWVS